MRRTAGDALSDLGDARAVPHAIAALEDGASLVRWRAARILGELGETAAVAPALSQAARAEKAFEVHPRTLTLSAQPGGTPAWSLVCRTHSPPHALSSATPPAQVAFELADARRKVEARAAGDGEGPSGPMWQQIQKGQLGKQC